jgi:hypothetical protein
MTPNGLTDLTRSLGPHHCTFNLELVNLLLAHKLAILLPQLPIRIQKYAPKAFLTYNTISSF